jgi:hypothetical protein
MEQAIARRFEIGERAPLSWDPVRGGSRGWICFEDDKTVDLGNDPSGSHFAEISERMLTGRYYPADAVRFYGRFQDEKREIRAGDRVLQKAPLFGRFGLLYAWSMVEIFVAERTEDRCKIGYVTTACHHGRGIWTAELTRQEGGLSLRVQSIASPQSWLFRLGLPVARYLQLRARKRAIEEFGKLCGLKPL